MTAPATRFAALLLATSLLAGCVTWIAPLSTRPVDQAQGTRTLGAKVEDEAIERKAYINIVRGIPAMHGSRLVATSWNGQLLLVGQVPDDGVRQRAAEIAGKVRHVQFVHNELVVGQPARLLVRMSDGWITTRVKARLLFGPDVPGRRVKVVTENGVVYLMGLVTRDEGEMIVNAARNVAGVQKIVKIFEYVEVSGEPAPAAAN